MFDKVVWANCKLFEWLQTIFCPFFQQPQGFVIVLPKKEKMELGKTLLY